MEKKPTRKPAVKKAVKKIETENVEATPLVAVNAGEFVKAIGRRKQASAQVKVFPQGKGKITVNNKEYKIYFPQVILNEGLVAPLKLAGRDTSVDVSALVRGGGIRGQADAVRLGISRALLLLDENLRTSLKKSSFLTRDPRVKERKKYGLKKARKAPQWGKR